MNNITGPPVEGDDFFGREKEIEYVWNRIFSGNNLIFPSPRRVGKTSFALKLLENAKSAGWQTVSINLEKISTEHDFVELFIKELKKLSWWTRVKDTGDTLLESLKKMKPTVDYSGVKVGLEWQSNKEDVYIQLSSLIDHDEKTLIFLDELTVLLISIANNGIDGKRNVAHFLHWLRDLRIEAGSKIKWIYCSSVGIENFTHRYGISDTLNDIHDYELKSYTKAESVKMLENLGTSNELAINNEISNAIVDKLEYCLPFFLQIMFEKVHVLNSIDNVPLELNIVDTAYTALIEEKHFNTWVERIEEQYEDNKLHALALLKHLCQAKEGVSRDNLINTLVASGLEPIKADDAVSKLIYMLKNDGYLIEEGRLYRFRSPLLRDFWFNRFLK